MAIMDQREERMKKDILGQLELSINQMDMAIMRASTPDEKRGLTDKLKTLEARRDALADECTNMSSAIGHLIQNPPQTPHASSSAAPATPPGLLQRFLPPPPPTPVETNMQLPATPSPSPVQLAMPPHMDLSTGPEKVEPAKKKS
jgi:hypothetical protein